MDDDPDQRTDLTALVMMTAKRVRRARMEALEPHGLSPHQAHAFLRIGRHHHHPQSRAQEFRLTDLARHLRIAPRSVTEVVDALCEKGLVERAPSPSDRRATIVQLTSAGEQLHADLAAQRSRGPSLFAPLDEQEQAQLAGLLRKLHGLGTAPPAQT